MVKAQSALEFLMIVGISLVLIIPALLSFFYFTQDAAYTTITSRVENIGNAMIETAQRVYFYGNQAREVLTIDFPQKVLSLEIQNNHEIVFTLEVPGGTTQNVFYSEIPLSGTFTEEDITQGIKQIRFENNQSMIEVSEID